MRVRLVVPRLADGGHRDRLWEYCRAYWAEQLPECELVEGHHEGDGPFNRSAAINRAAEGEWDMIVVLDSDTIVDPDQVRSAVAEAAESGELVLPFTYRNMLTQQGTERILAGFSGSWDGFIHARERRRVSCCVVVPRALWNEVGGFDERFEGWGGEDEAFHHACEVMRGARRTDGEVWHLWHRASPHHDHSTPLYRQALALTQRYKATTHPALMEQLLAEPRTPDSTVLMVLTTGTRETIADTIRSAEEKLEGPIGRKLIVVDGPTSRVHALQRRFIDWHVVSIHAGSYPKAVAAAMGQAIGSGQPWVFWLEDDFTFNRSIDLAEMQRLVTEHDLAQLSLKRQPWYEDEVAAGGIIEAKPEVFTQRDGYVEHRDYWTTNPMLTRRETLASYEWPQGRRSEQRFGPLIFDADPNARAGLLGSIADPPLVHHIGEERAGSGY